MTERVEFLRGNRSTCRVSRLPCESGREGDAADVGLPGSRSAPCSSPDRVWRRPIRVGSRGRSPRDEAGHADTDPFGSTSGASEPDGTVRAEVVYRPPAHSRPQPTVICRTRPMRRVERLFFAALGSLVSSGQRQRWAEAVLPLRWSGHMTRRRPSAPSSLRTPDPIGCRMRADTSWLEKLLWRSKPLHPPRRC